MRTAGAVLRAMFRTLSRLWGPQHWWPAESQFEVIVGAYLTQNTSWTNVERALENLRNADAVSVKAIREMPLVRLEERVRPSGYFRQKAERLKRFVAFLDDRYAGSLDRMFAEPTTKLREELLSLSGVGPETADSILLYAGGHEVFPVDAYTRRVLERHALLPATAPYDDIRALFEKTFRATDLAQPVSIPQPTSGIQDSATHSQQRPSSSEYEATNAVQPETVTRLLETDTALYGAAHTPSRASEMPRSQRAQVFSEIHAFIVGIGKNYCLKTAPLCEVCPLKRYLPEKPVPGFEFPVSGSPARSRTSK